MISSENCPVFLTHTYAINLFRLSSQPPANLGMFSTMSSSQVPQNQQIIWSPNSTDLHFCNFGNTRNRSKQEKAATIRYQLIAPPREPHILAPGICLEWFNLYDFGNWVVETHCLLLQWTPSIGHHKQEENTEWKQEIETHWMETEEIETH